MNKPTDKDIESAINSRLNSPIIGPLGDAFPRRGQRYRKLGIDLLLTRREQSGTDHRAAMRAMGMAIIVFPDKKTPATTAMGFKLAGLTMKQLCRRYTQFSHRASRAGFILAKMAEKSPFRPGVEEAAQNWRNFRDQVSREIISRAPEICE